MRKARRKRIVAMTLALSMLASSGGVCGAAAAEPDSTGLEVTVVPLDGADDDPAGPEDTPTEEKAAAAPQQPEIPTEDTPQDDISSPDKPDIERPEQSDTVETLPGTAKDNMEHIRGEDKAGSSETEAMTEAEKPDDTGTSSDGEKAPETDKPVDEQEPDAYPESKDFEFVYDPETKHFQVTFHITEDAEGDQTIELSKVLEQVDGYGQAEFDNWKKTKDYQDLVNQGISKINWTGDRFNDLKYVFDFKTGKASLYVEPGCTTVFDVSLANGSKHTYIYKDDSLTVSTPDMKNDDKTGVIGFDGQELPENYAKSYLSPKYNLDDPNANGVLETIIDEALKDSQSQWQYGVDKDGNLTTSHSEKFTKNDIAIGTPVYKIGTKYYLYSEKNDCYYCEFNSAQVQETPKGSGNYFVKSVPSSGKTNYAVNADGSKYCAPYERGSSISATKPSASRVQTELKRYLTKNNTTLADEILKYYNSHDGTSYSTIEELLANNPDAAKELTEGDGANAVLNPLVVRSSSQYDDFYKNILSFNVGSKGDIDDFLSDDSVDHGHGHGSWSSDENQMTIGDYMADKLNETDGAWDKANSYFQTLLASGLTAKETTWAAFTMATNIDGRLTGNDYQDTAWSWYASMVLHQADGTLHLTKTDEKGEVIGDDAGEGQTSFYLWKYETETDDSGNETEVPMYCTYVEPTYSTNDAGEQVLEKEGFYCWVKYDPEQDKMNYTITTTNGTLNIDYALLENVVYYLQEALAPEGYDADPDIYVICDQKTYDEMVDSGAFDNVENPAAGTSGPVAGWLGSIVGGGTLSINFVNTQSVPDDPGTPDITPKTPDEPAPPEKPDTPPVQEETPETSVPSQTPEAPAAETPRADVLPQTGTTFWLGSVLLTFGTALLGSGWFFTRKQHAPKH